MKQRWTLVCLVLAMALLFAGSIGAQEALYSKAYYVIRVAPHNLGYRVVYQTEQGEPAVTYLPIEWFRTAAGKATIIRGWDRSAPYMQVFWKDGNFSHLRLFVVPTYDHPSWGVIPGNVDPASAFNVDELLLHYN